MKLIYFERKKGVAVRAWEKQNSLESEDKLDCGIIRLDNCAPDETTFICVPFGDSPTIIRKAIEILEECVS